MLAYWNPWRDLSQLERDVVSYIGRTNGRANGAEKQASFTPPVDIYEDAAKFVIVADLPGVEEKDLDIRLEKDVLVVRGERKVEGGEGYTRTERARGGFARSFTLPPTVDGEKVSAELKAGVLTLTLPKKDQVKPRQIKVTAQG